MLKRIAVLAALVAALALPTSVAAQTPSKNITETAAGDPRFSTLVSLVERAGLADELAGNRQLTVFAPTDAAFEQVPQETLDALLADRALLREVLLYHVVPGRLASTQVVKRRSARTLQGGNVFFKVRNGNAFVNRAQVVVPDVRASNGIVHAINRVLVRPAMEKTIAETAAGDPRFSTLVSLVKRAGLLGALSGKRQLTVFAPTDAAFARVPKATLNALLGNRALLRKVLLYHVVPGRLAARQVVRRAGAPTLEGGRLLFRVRNGNAFVNRARVVVPDVRASNGIVHAINRVLVRPALGGGAAR